MRRKKEANKALRKAKTIDRCKWIKDKIKNCDKELLNSDYNRRRDEESKAMNRMKVDRDYFYTYVKKKLRTNTKIGPFVDDKGVVINKPITEQLNDQYAAMWSTPLEDKVIKDPETFFMNEEDDIDNPILTEVVFTKE